MNKQEIKDSIGVNIRTIRKMRGLNQIELAKSLGKTTAAFISLIENGERNISAADLVLVSNILKTDVRNLTKC